MNEKKEKFYQALVDYGQSDMYPMHMPGHKRKVYQSDALDEIRKIDITEIYQFDDQYENTGFLKVVQDRAAKIFKAENSRLMVNGSTGGVLAAISSVVEFGDKIIMARNSHKSAYNAVMIHGLDPVYAWPRVSKQTGIALDILPEKIEELLKENDDAKAVYITSPTYEGVISNIQAIAEITHKKGIPLIVDEAHGAHLSIEGNLCQKNHLLSAIDAGADIVIQSLHKTLPSFTQSAIIHYRKGYIDEEKLLRNLMVYQSSSPSYILLAGMERCLDILEEDGKQLFKEYHNQLKGLYHSLEKLKVIQVWRGEDAYGFDQGKIVLYLPKRGKWLMNQLREKYHIELEMASKDYALAMTSIMDSQDGFKRFCEALLEIDSSLLLSVEQHTETIITPSKPIKKMTIEQSLRIKTTQTNKKNRIDDYQEGEMCLHFIYAYPPGIPYICPGEIVNKELVELFIEMKENGIELKII